MTGFAPRARARVALLLVVVTLTLAGPALAQEDDESSGFWRGLWNTTPAGSLSDEQQTGLWSQTGRGIKAVWGSGQSDLFIPGYILSFILKMFGLLRVDPKVELTGLDGEATSTTYPNLSGAEAAFEKLQLKEGRAKI